MLDAEGIEVDRFEQCPAVHGEGVAADETVIVGCADGVLLYRDGAFTKLDSPDEFGGVGTAYATDTSPVAVVDYNPDPDAEGVLLSHLGFVDTAENTFDVAPLPEGVQHSWRGVGRDASDDAWLLGTDGALHKIDSKTREIVESVDVIEAWEGPTEWQEAHPALVVAGDIAYVTEPASNEVHRVDLSSGEVVRSASVDAPTTEIALVD